MLKNIFRNWQTSGAGIAALIAIATQAKSDPSTLLRPEVQAVIYGAIGLIFAKDGNKSGTATGG